MRTRAKPQRGTPEVTTNRTTRETQARDTAGGPTTEMSEGPESEHPARSPSPDNEELDEEIRLLERQVDQKKKKERISELKRVLGDSNGEVSSLSRTLPQRDQDVEMASVAETSNSDSTSGSSAERVIAQGQKRRRAPSMGEDIAEPVASGAVTRERNLPIRAASGAESAAGPQRTETRSSGSEPAATLPGQTKGPKPPRLENIPIYDGENLTSYNQFMFKLELAFRVYPEWFANDFNRLYAGISYLGRNQTQKWITHSQSVSRYRTLKFEDLRAFLFDQLDSVDFIRANSFQRYNDAFQRQAQTVRSFADYLTEQLTASGVELSEDAKMHTLRAKVREEIRYEISRYNRKCQTYDEMVALLHEIERNMPTRRDELKKFGKGKEKIRRKETGTKEDSGSQTTSETPKPRQDNKDKPGNKARIQCRYCKKFGHKQFECHKRTAEETETRAKDKNEAKK